MASQITNNGTAVVTPGSDGIALTYFTDLEARSVEALAERIIPREGDDPGATDAGVVYYIDRAVSGFSTRLQRVYRLGLRDLDRWCHENHRRRYVDLDTDSQDAVMVRFFGPPVRPEQDPGTADPGGHEASEWADSRATGPGESDHETIRRLFAVVREHTVEGYFCDPVYGGNRGTVGWQLVGFPGAQWGYTAAQMQPGYDAKSIVIKTLSDLRRDLADLPPNEHYTSNEIAPGEVIETADPRSTTPPVSQNDQEVQS